MVEEGLSRKARGALVLPDKPELRAHSRFYETVCLNRCWDVRVFEARPQAVEWLKSN